MHIGSNIGQWIPDNRRVLVEKPAHDRGIMIGFIGGPVPDLGTKRDIQIFETQIAFITDPVPGI